MDHVVIVCNVLGHSTGIPTNHNILISFQIGVGICTVLSVDAIITSTQLTLALQLCWWSISNRIRVVCNLGPRLHLTVLSAPVMRWPWGYRTRRTAEWPQGPTWGISSHNSSCQVDAPKTTRPGVSLPLAAIVRDGGLPVGHRQENNINLT